MSSGIFNRNLLAIAVLGALAVPAFAEEGAGATDFKSMVTEGSASLNFRYRYEYVDDDAFDRTAKASTLRSRLTFASAAYKGFSFLTEFDNVTNIGDDKYNSTTNGNTQYPVVADPKGTEVNQAWAKYQWKDLGSTYGRQRINHGNQRFIGGVAWRQNEQTYDGFRAQYSGALKVDYAYIYKINRIFGPDDGAQSSYWRGENHFLRADYKLGENHTFTGYAYSLEIDPRRGYEGGKSNDNSNRTVGLEYAGKLGPVGLQAAYAAQSDAGDSNLDYDADYYKLEGDITFAGLKANLGYEVLGGDNGVGFKTPLATLHKFQGWADKFLVTPGDGIEDLYVGLTGKAGPVKLGAFYHDFQAEDSSDDFGTELDLIATWPVNKLWTLQFKYANFSSDNEARFSDTQKAWMTVNLKI